MVLISELYQCSIYYYVASIASSLPFSPIAINIQEFNNVLYSNNKQKTWTKFNSEFYALQDEILYSS